MLGYCSKILAHLGAVAIAVTNVLILVKNLQSFWCIYFFGDHLWHAMQASFAVVCFLKVHSLKQKTGQLLIFFFPELELVQYLWNSDIDVLFTLRNWLHSHYRPFSALAEQTNEERMWLRLCIRFASIRFLKPLQCKSSAWCSAGLDLSVVYCTSMWDCKARCRHVQSSRAIRPGLAVMLASVETAALSLHGYRTASLKKLCPGVAEKAGRYRLAIWGVECSSAGVRVFYEENLTSKPLLFFSSSVILCFIDCCVHSHTFALFCFLSRTATSPTPTIHWKWTSVCWLPSFVVAAGCCWHFGLDCLSGSRVMFLCADCSSWSVRLRDFLDFFFSFRRVSPLRKNAWKKIRQCTSKVFV